MVPPGFAKILKVPSDRDIVPRRLFKFKICALLITAIESLIHPYRNLLS